jgi:anti-sigma B factor antagonist
VETRHRPKRDSLSLTFRERTLGESLKLKQELTVETREGNTVAILVPIGFINAHTVETFDTALRSVLDRGRYEVVINARSLAYVASAGLGALVGTIEEIRENGGDLRICELSDSVAAIFEMVGLPHLFKIFKTEDEAVSSFLVKA